MATKTFSRFLLIYCIVLFNSTCIAQNIYAEYVTVYKAIQINEHHNDTLTSSKAYSVSVPPFLYAYSYANQQSYITLIKGPGKTTATIITKNDPQTIKDVIDFPSKECIYKDLQKSIMYVTTTNSKGSHARQETLNKYAWKITKEHQTILGYTCLKATCVYNEVTITAWFTKQIKVLDGPLKYHGLPGLILKVTTGPYYETTATCIEVHKK